MMQLLLKTQTEQTEEMADDDPQVGWGEGVGRVDGVKDGGWVKVWWWGERVWVG